MAKTDSKRKREPSVVDDVEVKSPPPSAPEDEDDDGVQVRTPYKGSRVFTGMLGIVLKKSLCRFLRIQVQQKRRLSVT